MSMNPLVYRSLTWSSTLVAAAAFASVACGQSAGAGNGPPGLATPGSGGSTAGAITAERAGTGGVGGAAAHAGGAISASGNESGGAATAGASVAEAGSGGVRACPPAMAEGLSGGPIDVQVAISWDVVQRTISPMAYGLNGFNAFDPKQTTNATYLANLRHMKPGIMRLHNMGLFEDSKQSDAGWIDSTAKSWDAAKIAGALEPLVEAGMTLMINVPHWPSWMDANNDLKLDSDKFDEFAAFMAELVRIVNVQHKLGVKYWEVTNELEYRFDLLNQPDQTSQVVDLYNRACKAMKTVDPSILTGGPATSRADRKDLVTRFVHGTAPLTNPTTLDFFTFHSYGGDGKNSDDDAYEAATKWVGGYGASLSQILAQESPNRKVNLWFDEFAVTYAWQSKDVRTTNNKGAVWDALAITSALDNGVDWTSSWNEKDGFYGKMDPDNNLRVTAQLFYLLNNWLVGQRVNSTSSLPERVATFAVAKGDQHGVLLINRTDSAQGVSLAMTGWTPTSKGALVSRLDAVGFRSSTASWADIGKGLLLPPQSVVLLADGDPVCF